MSRLRSSSTSINPPVAFLTSSGVPFLQGHHEGADFRRVCSSLVSRPLFHLTQRVLNAEIQQINPHFSKMRSRSFTGRIVVEEFDRHIEAVVHFFQIGHAEFLKVPPADKSHNIIEQQNSFNRGKTLLLIALTLLNVYSIRIACSSALIQSSAALKVCS